MKKLITYTLITTIISCFSYVNPALANTQIKNENVIRLDLKEANIFNLSYNNEQLFLANNISDLTISEIDCSKKRIQYSSIGALLGSFVMTFMSVIISSIFFYNSYMVLPVSLIIDIFLGIILGAILGSFKGREIAIVECNINKKIKRKNNEKTNYLHTYNNYDFLF